MQVPLDQGFQVALEESRRQAILKGKGKPRMPSFPRPVWKYPTLQERKYVNYLISLFAPMSKASVRWVKNEYPGALAKYQGKRDGDAWGYLGLDTWQPVTCIAPHLLPILRVLVCPGHWCLVVLGWLLVVLAVGH